MFLNKGVTAGGEVGFSWIYGHRWGKCYFIEVLDFAIGINIKQIFNFCLSALSWHRKGESEQHFCAISYETKYLGFSVLWELGTGGTG